MAQASIDQQSQEVRERGFHYIPELQQRGLSQRCFRKLLYIAHWFQLMLPWSVVAVGEEVSLQRRLAGVKAREKILSGVAENAAEESEP